MPVMPRGYGAAMAEPRRLDARELAAMSDAKEVTLRVVIEAPPARIEPVNPELNAVTATPANGLPTPIDPR